MVVEREEVDYSVFIDCTPLYDDIEWDPILVALQGGGPLPNSDLVLVAPPQNALAPDPPLLALQGGGSHPDSDPVVVAPPQNDPAVHPLPLALQDGGSPLNSDPIMVAPLQNAPTMDSLPLALQGRGPPPNSDPVVVTPPQNAQVMDLLPLAMQGDSPPPDSDLVVVALSQNALAVNPVQVDQTPNGGDVDLEITDLPSVDTFNPEEVMEVEVAEAEVMEMEVEAAAQEAEVEVMVVEVAAEDENPRQLRRRGRPRKIPSAAEIAMPESSARQLRVRPSRVRPQTNPNALRRVVRRTNRDEDFKLPSGWIEVRIARKSGASVGHVDRYFIEKKTGEKCRSRAEVTTYLAAQAQRKKQQAQPQRNGAVVIQG